MTNKFYEWLDECPVQWFRLGVDKESIEYSFTITEDEAEEL